MSFRQQFKNFRSDEQDSHIVLACHRVLERLQRDIDIVAQKMSGKRKLIHLFKGTHGRFNADANTLTYEIYNEKSILYPRNYDGRTQCNNQEALKKQKFEDLRQHGALLPVHALCASAAIDTRMEIDVISGVATTWSGDNPFYQSRTALRLTVHLDQPYSASTLQPAPPQPPAAPVAAPAAAPTVFTTPKIDTGIKTKQGN